MGKSDVLYTSFVTIKVKNNWAKISRITNYEDFFHKYLINPECIKLLSEFKTSTGADIGCGNGILINHLIKSGIAKKMFAIDISNDMLSKANKNNTNLDNIEYIQSDATQILKVQDSMLDFVSQVMFYHTIELVEDAIKETYRVLKKNGVLLVVMPHPLALFKNKFISLKEFDSDNYLQIRKDIFEWDRMGQKVKMDFFYRPISFYLNMFLSNGFDLIKMTEPPIGDEAKGVKSNEKFSAMQAIPWFIFLKFRKQ